MTSSVNEEFGCSIQFASDPDFEHLIAIVTYKDMGLFTLCLDDEGEKVHVVVDAHDDVVSPFVGHVEISEYAKILAWAETKYNERLALDYNPMLRR